MTTTNNHKKEKLNQVTQIKEKKDKNCRNKKKKEQTFQIEPWLDADKQINKIRHTNKLRREN
ncbi:hypothetical protein BpHYR1_029105 [Brachionus plicatilis]|uniref:Uncharacterized protein n=1 Tax=Brachionus plicatilis TaxID=10195 RepID=A0A3M7PBW7_BRAPC|nr:hypothetical protein BpHYR1_029105 [Brachionus plicatilis]